MRKSTGSEHSKGRASPGWPGASEPGPRAGPGWRLCFRAGSQYGPFSDNQIWSFFLGGKFCNNRSCGNRWYCLQFAGFTIRNLIYLYVIGCWKIDLAENRIPARRRQAGLGPLNHFQLPIYQRIITNYVNNVEIAIDCPLHVGGPSIVDFRIVHFYRIPKK